MEATPQMDQAAKRLFAVWQEARGSKLPPLSIAEKHQIVRALVAREEDATHSKPLEYCPICQCEARGPHQLRARGARA